MVKEVGRIRIFAEVESVGGTESGGGLESAESGPSLWKLYVKPAWDRESSDPEVVIQIHESSDEETWGYIAEYHCEPSTVGYNPTPIFGLRSDRYYRVHLATISSAAEEAALEARTPLGYYVDDSSSPGPVENAKTLDSSYDGITITVQPPETFARIKPRRRRGK
jgi:hypothetical protein